MGRSVAVYRIDKFLGEGGFAYVYKARDTNLDIDVALKVLKPAFAYDEVFEENFRREAHRAAKFRHPNVVAIHYAGKDDDIVFFSMDLLESGLKDLLEPGVPVHSDIIIRVGIDVASALQFAHTHEGGIVHRDLKPDNILFDRHGNAVVTDFGIAEAATSYTAATGTTVYVGTPKYMSPEQARGQRVDHRSDIYSLGVTLFEMAVGEPPFTGRDWFELGRKHIEEPPPLPREKNRNLSPELESVILKCLQKSPADRYQSARHLSGDLQALKEGTLSPIPLAELRSQRPAVATPPTPAPSVQRARQQEAREAQRGPADLYSATTQMPRKKRRAWIWLTLAGLLAGAIAAFAYDLAGFRTWGETQLPQLAGIPYIGSGSVYATGFMFASVEGGAVVDGEFDITFSGSVARETATADNVQLIGHNGRQVRVQVTLAPDGRRITVKPARPLAFQTAYTLRVAPGLLSTRGTAIMQRPGAEEPGCEWRFETGRTPPDSDPPYLLESAPANRATEVPLRQTFTLLFNEALDLNTVSTASVKLSDERGSLVPVDVLVSTDDQRTIRVRPDQQLQSGSRYSLLLTAAILDRSGNPLIPDTIAFTTAAGDAAVATAPARLNITVRPKSAEQYVRVRIDGQLLGYAPRLDVRVAAGVRHTVELLAGPRESSFLLPVHYDERVVVGPGERKTIDPEIKPFGWVTVISQPYADVFVDGKYVATAPVAGYTLFAGTHELELHPLSGDAGSYNTLSQVIEVPPFSELRLADLRLPRAN